MENPRESMGLNRSMGGFQRLSQGDGRSSTQRAYDQDDAGYAVERSRSKRDKEMEMNTTLIWERGCLREEDDSRKGKSIRKRPWRGQNPRSPAEGAGARRLVSWGGKGPGLSAARGGAAGLAQAPLKSTRARLPFVSTPGNLPPRTVPPKLVGHSSLTA